MKQRKRNRTLFAILTVFLFSCSTTTGVAYHFSNNNQLYIKLVDEITAVTKNLNGTSSKTFVDSLTLGIPYIDDGVISGEQITDESGSKIYSGNIIISKGKLLVQLKRFDSTIGQYENIIMNGKYKFAER